MKITTFSLDLPLQICAFKHVIMQQTMRPLGYCYQKRCTRKETLPNSRQNSTVSKIHPKQGLTADHKTFQTVLFLFKSAGIQVPLKSVKHTRW